MELYSKSLYLPKSKLYAFAAALRIPFPHFLHSMPLPLTFRSTLFPFFFPFKLSRFNQSHRSLRFTSRRINFAALLHDDCRRSRRFFSRVSPDDCVRRRWIQSVDDLIDNEIPRSPSRFLSAVRRRGRDAPRSRSSVRRSQLRESSLHSTADSRKRNLPFARRGWENASSACISCSRDRAIVRSGLS